MSAKIKLSSKLPGNPDINGLDQYADEIHKTPETVRVALIHFDAPNERVENFGAKHIPVIEIRRIELLGDVDSVPVEIREAFLKLAESRLGKQPLPFDETDTSAAGTGALD